MLQTLLQSYQNVSNSQLTPMKHLSALSCKRFCKVIKMLAIHNNSPGHKINHNVANAFAKLSKCQQFTTSYTCTIIPALLQTLLQSYQNVSNSQHLYLFVKEGGSCKRFCKVIKMLAIHNNSFDNTFIASVANAFAKLSKCQQFTTVVVRLLFIKKLQTLLQSYQNVSNSQPSAFLNLDSICCKRFCKVIKMLAIHNYQKGLFFQ